jgi:C-terminal processing protease CtpA/Prc
MRTLAGLLLVPSLLAAQARPCHGPGAAFGVTSYRCTSCGIQVLGGRHTSWIFHVEPVVLDTAYGSLLRPGDVVVGINGRPITSVDGADQFAYPEQKINVIRVRRENLGVIELTTMALASCPRRDSATAQRQGSPAGTVAGRIGFALGCLPSCTRVKASDGTDYWKFDGEPPVVALIAGGAAERAGLRVGDRVIRVDGHAIGEEAGALRILRLTEGQSVRLTVRRDGRVVEVTVVGDR